MSNFFLRYIPLLHNEWQLVLRDCLELGHENLQQSQLNLSDLLRIGVIQLAVARTRHLGVEQFCAQIEEQFGRRRLQGGWQRVI